MPGIGKPASGSGLGGSPGLFLPHPFPHPTPELGCLLPVPGPGAVLSVCMSGLGAPGQVPWLVRGPRGLGVLEVCPAGGTGGLGVSTRGWRETASSRPQAAAWGEAWLPPPPPLPAGGGAVCPGQPPHRSRWSWAQPAGDTLLIWLQPAGLRPSHAGPPGFPAVPGHQKPDCSRAQGPQRPLLSLGRCYILAESASQKGQGEGVAPALRPGVVLGRGSGGGRCRAALGAPDGLGGHRRAGGTGRAVSPSRGLQRLPGEGPEGSRVARLEWVRACLGGREGPAPAGEGC